MVKGKILIIDDNPMNLELVSDLLEVNGFEVLQANDALTGIDIAKQEKPDLILMDIQLPGMDGLTATKILRAEPATKTIPIVALTAHAMKGDEKKVLYAGCVGYISKPIDTRAFPVMVHDFIKKK
jgi:CheY-like chemotaxis protein